MNSVRKKLEPSLRLKDLVSGDIAMEVVKSVLFSSNIAMFILRAWAKDQK